MHKELSKENQDFMLHSETDKVEIIVLADGVSSCALSGKGAKIACKTVINMLSESGRKLFSMDKKTIAEMVLNRVKENLKVQQKRDNCHLTEYSSTLCFVCLNKETKYALCFSLGDSLIYKLSADGCILLNQPDIGWKNECCATTTIGATKRVKINIIEIADLNGMMICSDGAWRLFYNHNIFDENLWECTKEQKYYEFKKHIEKSSNKDDSTFIIMDFLQERIP